MINGIISGKITKKSGISGNLSNDIIPDSYDGTYEVIPMTYDQYLNTANKYLNRDVHVHEIPYAEVSNVYGTTITIAS